jgi:hypothetical protein
MANLAEQFMAYESGEMDSVDTVEFFSDLIQDGLINGLQGSYHRTAVALIEAGCLSVTGEVLGYGDED